MCKDKRYIIIAGVNGAGKTTLYRTANAGDPARIPGIRLNADETLEEMGLDWRSPAAQVTAGRDVLRRLDRCFSAGETCNHETTLCGSSIQSSIRRAKELGYAVHMLYAGVASPDIAMGRVAFRVAHGGHGVPEETVLRRYFQSQDGLLKAAPHCGSICFIDNTKDLTLVAEVQSVAVICGLTANPGHDCAWVQSILEKLPQGGGQASSRH
ncbi:MAG: ATPase [Clostridia bacterium]|nr:ATPase [Clostridia bacterium]